MPKLRVHGLTMSLDGYVAGADQSHDNPLGVGGGRLHEWMFVTHHPRPPVTMEGGTTFHFVADGIGAALERAITAAGGKDVPGLKVSERGWISSDIMRLRGSSLAHIWLNAVRPQRHERRFPRPRRTQTFGMDSFGAESAQVGYSQCHA
jgi:hypothetical protein